MGTATMTIGTRTHGAMGETARADARGGGRHVVLGATGAIGYWTARHLLDRGERVVLLARSPERARERFPKDEPGLTIVAGDAERAEDMRRAAEGAATLFYNVNLPYPAWHDSAHGVVPLLGHAIAAAADTGARLVFPGNVYVFGRVGTQPSLIGEGQPFAAHTRKGRLRVTMERMLDAAWRERGVAYTTVRMPDFYGCYVENRLYRPLFENALSGKPLTWYGALDVPLELIDAADGAAALVEAGLDPGSIGQVYHVPGGGATTAREWLGMLARLGGARASIRTVPAATVRLFGLIDREAREFAEMRYLKAERLLLDGSKYRAHFGHIPSTPYDVGIARTLQWYRAGRPGVSSRLPDVGNLPAAATLGPSTR